MSDSADIRIVKNLVLAIEALVCGAVLTFLVWVFHVMSIGHAVQLLLEFPASGANLLLEAVAMTWPVLQYWKLTTWTVLNWRYPFGVGFWLAVSGAVYNAVIWSAVLDTTSLLFFAGPITFATLHFSFLQYRVQRRMSLCDVPMPNS